jgi:hypothetical protein
MAKKHTVYAVPIAAEEFVSGVAANSSAVDELKRAEHIPILLQQMAHQSFTFLFALRDCHACPPRVFINEAGGPFIREKEGQILMAYD